MFCCILDSSFAKVANVGGNEKRNACIARRTSLKQSCLRTVETCGNHMFHKNPPVFHNGPHTSLIPNRSLFAAAHPRSTPEENSLGIKPTTLKHWSWKAKENTFYRLSSRCNDSSAEQLEDDEDSISSPQVLSPSRYQTPRLTKMKSWEPTVPTGRCPDALTGPYIPLSTYAIASPKVMTLAHSDIWIIWASAASRKMALGNTSGFKQRNTPHSFHMIRPHTSFSLEAIPKSFCAPWKSMRSSCIANIFQHVRAKFLSQSFTDWSTSSSLEPASSCITIPAMTKLQYTAWVCLSYVQIISRAAWLIKIQSKTN